MVASEPVVQVSWVYSLEDESVARELLRLAGVLERQGLLRNRPMDLTALSEAMRDENYPIGSGIAVFLVSTICS